MVKSFDEFNQYIDKRTIAIHPEPHNKLSAEEVQQILKCSESRRI
jgi:hypothetical protein